jgi:2-(3-amino-3-carboxypropyl)histidine synthase
MISEETLQKLKKIRAKNILIQIPEGLKTKALDIITFLEKNGFNAAVSCEPCFGACDLRDHEAKILGFDVLLHIGHTDFGIKTEIPTIYDEYLIDYNPEKILKKNLEKLRKYKRIGLLTTIQFKNSIPLAKKILEKSGKTVCVSKNKKTGVEGQILGCDYSAAMSIEECVDCFLFLGSGRFHPMGLLTKTKKPVLFLDFEKGMLEDLSGERSRIEKVRFARIEKAKEYKTFGILVSTKKGQMRIKTAQKIKKRLENKGKKACVLIMDQITPEKIMGMKLDALVNTACPRLSDDYKMFGKIILNPEDVDKL